MRYLGKEDTRSSLPMSDAIGAMEWAFTGEVEAPLRSLVGNSLVMPGRLDDRIAIKVVSITPGNPAGVVVVFDREGTPLGVVDGPTITAIRTGAVCGLATRLLTSPRPVTLAMLGAGAMAFDQVEGIKAVRTVEKVLVWSRDFSRAGDLASRVGGEPVADADDAVSRANVVSCATPSRSPLFSADSVGAGTHVNAVGAFTPEMAELPPELLDRAYVVVDDLAAAAAEAGDLIQADRAPNTTLRALLEVTAPQVGEDTTVFKSVGIAAQDVAAAARALANAEEMGRGLIVS
jgi:ornithine cyclodeaminase